MLVKCMINHVIISNFIIVDSTLHQITAYLLHTVARKLFQSGLYQEVLDFLLDYTLLSKLHFEIIFSKFQPKSVL